MFNNVIISKKNGEQYMDKKEALKIWEHEFGSLEYAYDITGRKIKRDDYMVNNQVGWVVAYMRPLSKGGKMDDGNTIILHHHTAYEKGENYPIFTVDCVEYSIQYDETDDFYYIEKTNHRVDEI